MPALDLADIDALAQRAHAGQQRRHGAPYIDHPRAVRLFVEDLACATGFSVDDETRAVALLHDVIEDSDLDELALAERVGSEVARRVSLLSKPPLAPGDDVTAHTRRYFETLLERADDTVRLVKVADRLHNLSELHLAPDPTRLTRYLEETRRFLLPLARGASSRALAKGLEQALLEANALAARLQGVNAEERARLEDQPPRGLYPIVDVGPGTVLEDAQALLGAVVEGGAGLVQVRCKNVDDRTALAFVEALLPIARKARVPLVVNDRADLARVSGADGLHVGQTDLPPPRLRPLLDEGAIVGKSSHTLAQALGVVREGGVTYVAFGPVFSSPTKQGHADVTGLSALAEVTGAVPLPVCAIGGLTEPSRMADIARAGAALGAVISALSSSSEPRLVARRLSLAHAAAFAVGNLPP